MPTIDVVIPTRELVGRLRQWDHLFDHCDGVRGFIASHALCIATWEDETHRKDVADEVFYKHHFDYSLAQRDRNVSENESIRWGTRVLELNNLVSHELYVLMLPIFQKSEYDISHYDYNWRSDDLIVKVDYWYG